MIEQGSCVLLWDLQNMRMLEVKMHPGVCVLVRKLGITWEVIRNASYWPHCDLLNPIFWGAVQQSVFQQALG